MSSKGARGAQRNVRGRVPGALSTRAARGGALAQQGKLAEARTVLDEAARAGDATVEVFVLLASVRQRLGDAAGAADALHQATQRFPDDWRPYTRLGALLAEHLNWEGAATCFAAAVQLRPDNADIAFNLGTALREAGRHEEAIQAFENLATMNPAYGPAFLGLGLTYRLIGAAEAALMAFDVAADTMPEDARPLGEAVRTRIDAGMREEALATLGRMGTRFERDAAVNTSRGVLLQELGCADEAFAAFTQALDIDDRQVAALNNRGSLLLLNRRFSEAISDFDRALAIEPDLEGLRSIRLYAAMHVFDWRQWDDGLHRLVQDLADGRPRIQPLIVQTVLDDPALQQRASRLWMQAQGQGQGQRQGHSDDDSIESPRSSRRLRIAYVSRDFRSHPVSYLMAEVIELHDRESFEVVAINYGHAKDDTMQHRLRAAFDVFHDVASYSDLEVASLCRRLEVDIAIDLTGFTDGARPGIFAARAAPLQLLYLGFLGTSGSRAYDYLIADKVLIPEEARSFYDERLLLLPWYQANDRQRPVPATGLTRDHVGLPQDAFVLCCFNNPCKILPEQWERWAAILHGAPHAVLWVLEEDAVAAANLRRHAMASGLSAERIVFAPRVARDAYLERLAFADLFLDTLPYNAGTTASDALWMGVPVLTVAGKSFPARMAASVLSAIGCEHLIAADPQAYVAKAIELARDADAFAKVKESVRKGRAAGRLFDAVAFTRHLERGLKQVHAHRLAGHAPADQIVE
ncbi:tetratricopeptide repeat protein [Roseateles sp. L2-2]|uniref:tetratricopeptide repeat protein n=1 Tax=Roseateles sp. L2-2 TaxID=3422597 RepID=UPI003D35B8C6